MASIRLEMRRKAAGNELNPAIFEEMDFDFRTFNGDSIEDLLKSDVISGTALGSPRKAEF